MKGLESSPRIESEAISLFDYGDRVRIKSSGLVGDICDISARGAGLIYVIDQHAYKKTDDADEWLLEVTEKEIEPA